MISRLKTWLRKKLKEFLEQAPEGKIRVVTPEGTLVYDVVDCSGPDLICVRDSRERVVRPADAADGAEFARERRRFAESGGDPTWEDGTPANLDDIFPRN